MLTRRAAPRNIVRMTSEPVPEPAAVKGVFQSVITRGTRKPENATVPRSKGYTPVLPTPLASGSSRSSSWMRCGCSQGKLIRSTWAVQISCPRLGSPLGCLALVSLRLTADA